MECPECFLAELEETDSCLLCPECGSMFDQDSDEDDPQLLEED